jgi:hypothetical protein
MQVLSKSVEQGRSEVEFYGALGTIDPKAYQYGMRLRGRRSGSVGGRGGHGHLQCRQTLPT